MLTSRLSRLGLGVAIALAALVSAQSASAVIIPQKGMAGVRLGMTRAKVRAVLGSPKTIFKGKNEFGSFTSFNYARVQVSFQGNQRVTNLRTQHREEKTRGGVGFGTTERLLRARVRGLRCKTEYGFRHCWLGAFLAGRRVTNFMLSGGRVSRIDIGFVID